LVGEGVPGHDGPTQTRSAQVQRHPNDGVVDVRSQVGDASIFIDAEVVDRMDGPRDEFGLTAKTPALTA
jgi:hypothetical protein